MAKWKPPAQVGRARDTWAGGAPEGPASGHTMALWFRRLGATPDTSSEDLGPWQDGAPPPRQSCLSRRTRPRASSRVVEDALPGQCHRNASPLPPPSGLGHKGLLRELSARRRARDSAAASRQRPASRLLAPRRPFLLPPRLLPYPASQSQPAALSTAFFSFLAIEVQLIYNIVRVSSVQQSDAHIFFQIIFYDGLLQDTEYIIEKDARKLRILNIAKRGIKNDLVTEIRVLILKFSHRISLTSPK